MLAMSPIMYQSLGWEYPMELGLLQHDALNLDNYHLNNNNNDLEYSLINLPNNNNNVYNIPSNDNNDYDYDYNQTVEKKRSESPGSASSGDHVCGNVLAKKLNHNASERDRRKKINDLYSTLRALLPPSDHSKKLSIPNTVGRVLKYIPELQKEVDDLIQRKEDLLSKCSLLRGVTSSELFNEEKPKMKDILKTKNSCVISSSKLRENEIIVQISSRGDISLPDILVKLEKDGLLVVDVSSFQSFGGSTFYNIHLFMESGNNVNCEMLNVELPYFVGNTNMNTYMNMNTNINVAQTYPYR